MLLVCYQCSGFWSQNSVSYEHLQELKQFFLLTKGGWSLQKSDGSRCAKASYSKTVQKDERKVKRFCRSKLEQLCLKGIEL